MKKKLLLAAAVLVGFGLFAACSQGEQHPPMLGDCDGCGNPIIPGVTDAKADVMPDTKADVMNDAGTTADATDATADAADAAAEAGDAASEASGDAADDGSGDADISDGAATD